MGTLSNKELKLAKQLKPVLRLITLLEIFVIFAIYFTKKKTLLLNLNPIILNLVKPRLFYGGCSLQNKIKMPRTSVQKVTQNKIKKARI